MANDNKHFSKWNRRDILKTLGGIPLVGGVWYSGASLAESAQREKQFLLETLNIKASPPPATGPMSGKPLRIGIIGFGIRGEQLCRSLGFATTGWLKNMQEALDKNPKDTRLADFKAQESLNVKLAAICDVFDTRAENALASFNTGDNKIKRFRTYTELIHSGEVDAVIIATPDHWHAPMSIEALNAGVHVYVEKPMTHNIAETYALREAVRNNPKAVFAVGHQHRQTQSFLTAQDIIQKNILGHVSLIQTNTNRNDDNGAWQYEIAETANPKTIDWDQFLGSAPKVTTGGTQEAGKEKGMTFVYSATLGNQFDRGTVLMGHDGSMELGNRITVYADPRSTKYADLIKEQRIEAGVPIYQYDPAVNGTDAVTSATAKYFANKGLLWTYRDGKRVDSTFLHLREWLSCIRNGGTPSCSIKEGFEEAISAHMGGLSYKLGRRIEWDPVAEQIIAKPGEDLDAILLQNT